MRITTKQRIMPMPMYDDKRGVKEANIFSSLTGESHIETLEAQGQQDLVNSTHLPRCLGEFPRERYTNEWGVIFKDNVNDLFVNCDFPEGWKLEATNHNMWSSLKDDKGRVRASVFYKAAFYDRSSHMGPDRFYYTENNPDRHVLEVKERNNNVLMSFPYDNSRRQEYIKAHKKAQDWIFEKYLDHNNPFAYWD